MFFRFIYGLVPSTVENAESSLRFPEVSEKRLNYIFRLFSAIILVGDLEFIENSFGTSLRRKNPSLYRYIGKVVGREQWGQDTDFRMGAYFVDAVLDPKLPRVNRVIISQYDRQFEAYTSFLRNNIESGIAIAEQYHPELRVDWDYPVEENYLLRKFLSTRPMLFVLGGLTVYELKRRAFFARYLKKTFGISE